MFELLPALFRLAEKAAHSIADIENFHKLQELVKPFVTATRPDHRPF